MKEIMVIQGRSVTSEDLQLIRRLIEENPSWRRTRLSMELCQRWDWRARNGQYKDMACRTFLLKLHRQGQITLPPPLTSINNAVPIGRDSVQDVPHQKIPIASELQALTPIHIMPVQDAEQKALFKTFLARYHYLGYAGSVGENMKYLVIDRRANPVACLLFGSAAWKVAPRDIFIGWDAQARQRHLHLLTNNMRFLILPWVRVPHLAGHILGRLAKRISADWERKYAHPIYLLETFVERERFRGVCYKAANWRHVGQTTGRTRNDRDRLIRRPIKDVYLYPLTKDFRQALSKGN